jgi:hypothetical protein
MGIYPNYWKYINLEEEISGQKYYLNTAPSNEYCGK